MTGALGENTAIWPKEWLSWFKLCCYTACLSHNICNNKDCKQLEETMTKRTDAQAAAAKAAAALASKRAAEALEQAKAAAEQDEATDLLSVNNEPEETKDDGIEDDSAKDGTSRPKSNLIPPTPVEKKKGESKVGSNGEENNDETIDDEEDHSAHGSTHDKSSESEDEQSDHEGSKPKAVLPPSPTQSEKEQAELDQLGFDMFGDPNAMEMNPEDGIHGLELYEPSEIVRSTVMRFKRDKTGLGLQMALPNYSIMKVKHNEHNDVWYTNEPNNTYHEKIMNALAKKIRKANRKKRICSDTVTAPKDLLIGVFKEQVVELAEMAHSWDGENKLDDSRQPKYFYELCCNFNEETPVVGNEKLQAIMKRYFEYRIGWKQSIAKSEIQMAMEAIQQTFVEQDPSNTTGTKHWTFPFVMMLIPHIAHMTNVPTIRYHPSAQHDSKLVDTRRQGTKMIWATKKAFDKNDPINKNRKQTKAQMTAAEQATPSAEGTILIGVESREDVVEKIVKYLNDLKPEGSEQIVMATDEGAPAETPTRKRKRTKVRNLDEDL